MPEHFAADSPELREGLLHLHREFFDRAEKKRRWSISDDIPWEKANREMDPAVADVVESFCMVEMYLPDYIGKALPMVRANRGWTAFHANWGYEESKHSTALGDWLLRSGARSDEQMADLYSTLVENEYDLPEDSPAGMVIYAMVQELATHVHYKNLRLRVEERGDPALSKLLTLVGVDERAHHAFYRSVVRLFLQMDRKAALEQLRRVLTTFEMPAVRLFPDGSRRAAKVRELGIFDEEVYFREVYQPLLESLGVSRQEVRRPAMNVR
jgi:acyl-[acyl-carrier-protein] desaturase